MFRAEVPLRATKPYLNCDLNKAKYGVFSVCVSLRMSNTKLLSFWMIYVGCPIKCVVCRKYCAHNIERFISILLALIRHVNPLVLIYDTTQGESVDNTAKKRFFVCYCQLCVVFNMS